MEGVGWQPETYQSDEQAQQEWEQETGPREQHDEGKLTPQKAHGHFLAILLGQGSWVLLIMASLTSAQWESLCLL